MYSDALLAVWYTRQMDNLDANIGERVNVKSSGWGNPPQMQAGEQLLIFEPGTFVNMGNYVNHEGILTFINPFQFINIETHDGRSELPSDHGLPFVGASSIREVTRHNGDVIYFNPLVDKGFSNRFMGLKREEAFAVRRLIFGSAEDRSYIV